MTKIGLSFFYMVPNGSEIVAHATYINIKNMVLFFSKIGAARNLAGRNYVTTGVWSVISDEAFKRAVSFSVIRGSKDLRCW